MRNDDDLLMERSKCCENDDFCELLSKVWFVFRMSVWIWLHSTKRDVEMKFKLKKRIGWGKNN